MKNRFSFVVLLGLATISLSCICGNSGSRIGRGRINRGVPTEDGIYCPAHDEFISSEDDFGPRCYRNQRLGRGRGRGMGRGRMGRGVPTKDGIYCPAHDEFISSEEDFGPRCYRNQRLGRGRGRGMGRGMGRRCRFWW